MVKNLRRVLAKKVEIKGQKTKREGKDEKGRENMVSEIIRDRFKRQEAEKGVSREER